MKAHEFREEAWDLLAHASPSSDAGQLAWAAGTAKCWHVSDFAHVWGGGRLADRHTSSGGTLGRHAGYPFYACDTKGLHLGDTPLVDQPIVTVRWQPIEHLMGKAGARLRGPAVALIAQRGRLVDAEDRLRRRRVRGAGGDEIDRLEGQHGELWRRVEGECEAVAAHIWKTLRPDSIQLDLLELLA